MLDDKKVGFKQMPKKCKDPIRAVTVSMGRNEVDTKLTITMIMVTTYLFHLSLVRTKIVGSYFILNSKNSNRTRTAHN